MAEIGEIKKILYITLSNLGDAMMGLPAFDFLRREYPDAHITVVVAPRTRCLFKNHPDVNRIIIFDKASRLRDKIALFFRLRREQFDCIVDLKNTFYRFGLKAKYKNPIRMAYPKWAHHSSYRHLLKAIAAVRGIGVSKEEFLELNTRRNPSFITAQDQNYIETLLHKHGVSQADKFVLIAPGARSNLKRWPKDGYLEVVRGIRRNYGHKVIVIGGKEEKSLVEEVTQRATEGVIGLGGDTTFGQLCALVQRAELLIGNDSGILHIASYLDRPVIGIFGPSDYKRYGPWSKRRLSVRKSILCAPCGRTSCPYHRQCIEKISVYDVMSAVRLMFNGRETCVKDVKYRRILLVRTDRMGDVLLSTPAIKSVRDHYPMSFIAMMVSVANRDLVEGNPYLDEVIAFDKDKRHKGLFGTIAFSNKIKSFGFDTALILHPTVRVHLICFLAGIKTRIGYDRKAPYFLTQVIPHRKQEGQKHEVEYNFDILKPLGITTINRQLYMPIRESSTQYVHQLLLGAGITSQDKIVAVHPAASCISKRWPLKKVAEVIDWLTVFENVKVVVVADVMYNHFCEELFRLTKYRPVDFCGKLNLSQLASLLERCELFISNDSGPVHLCTAVGTPVISIFGRNQPGLGPVRWGPVGKDDIVLHKKTECLPCLAHNCKENFKCLEAIAPEEVKEHAQNILKQARHKNNNIFKQDSERQRSAL